VERPALKLNIETHGGTTLAIAEGRLDFGAANGFQKQLEQELAGAGSSAGGARAPVAALILDCGGVDYVLSAGLRVFLVVARAAKRDGVAFSICALQPAVREVFDLSGFSRIITVHADRASALAQAGHSSA
jgi:anti-anti-sigma factor